jgi:hypothetical protein
VAKPPKTTAAVPLTVPVASKVPAPTAATERIFYPLFPYSFPYPNTLLFLLI